MGLTETAFVEEMAAAYVECALWSSSDFESGTPLDEDHDSDDVDGDTLAQMREDVDAFYTANAADLADMTPGQAGHDFWLTRNGHGAGFWDRWRGELGDRLTAAAHAYGSFDLYVGDDGKVYGN
jgi:hypothetical protein